MTKLIEIEAVSGVHEILIDSFTTAGKSPSMCVLFFGSEIQMGGMISVAREAHTPTQVPFTPHVELMYDSSDLDRQLVFRSRRARMAGIESERDALSHGPRRLFEPKTMAIHERISGE